MQRRRLYGTRPSQSRRHPGNQSDEVVLPEAGPKTPFRKRNVTTIAADFTNLASSGARSNKLIPLWIFPVSTTASKCTSKSIELLQCLLYTLENEC